MATWSDFIAREQQDTQAWKERLLNLDNIPLATDEQERQVYGEYYEDSRSLQTSQREPEPNKDIEPER